MQLNIFINRQINNLRKRMCNFGFVPTEFQAAEDAYLFYRKEIKSFRGWVKSFLPFTKARKLRLICAERLEAASKCFLNIEIESKAKRKTLSVMPPAYPNSANKIPKKNYSDGDVAIQKENYSKIFSRPPANVSDFEYPTKWRAPKLQS